MNIHVAGSSSSSVVPTSRRGIRLAAAISTLLGLAACAGDSRVTDSPISAKLSHQCFVMLKGGILSEYWGFFMAPLVQVPGSSKCFPLEVDSSTKELRRYKVPLVPTIPECPFAPVAQLPVGQKFEVVDVIDEASGSSGRCWQVKGKLIGGDHAGLAFDLPTCIHSHHAHPNWLEAEGRFISSGVLKFDPQLVAPCQ